MIDGGLTVAFGLFALAAVVIGLAGTQLTRVADRLADRTGWGEAFVGTVLLGAVTSLSGMAAVVTTASDGFAELAFSTAIGGIAAQTAFLAIADFAYRKINLEHAAASLPNLLAGAALVTLLALLLAAIHAPEIDFFGVHPVTPVLLLAYLAAVRLIHAGHRSPMWWPRPTPQTRQDLPDQREAVKQHKLGLFAGFSILAALVASAGWVLAKSAEDIMAATGLSDSFVGGVMVAVTTSLPELITTLVAVRIGALTLAVAGIIGGNVFDVLFVGLADVAYREGSIYHALGDTSPAVLALTLVMVGVLMMGMLHREQKGPANIGYESLLMLMLYGVGLALLIHA